MSADSVVVPFTGDPRLHRRPPVWFSTPSGVTHGSLACPALRSEARRAGALSRWGTVRPSWVARSAIPPTSETCRRCTGLDRNRSSRSRHLAGLAAELADVIADTVDPFDLAAALEARGINDRAATRYGHADVFSLAEGLLALDPDPSAVPPAPPAPAVRPVELDVLAFLAPALLTASALRLLPAGSGVVTVVLAVLASWGLSQVTAFQAHAALGRRDPDGARRLLRWSLVGGLSGWLAAGSVVAVVLGESGVAVLLGVAQMTVMSAATTLTVLGARHLVLGTFSPGLVVGLADLTVPAMPSWLVAAGVTATVASALWLTHRITRPGGAPTPPAGLRPPGLVSTAPYALYGVTMASLLLGALALGPSRRLDATALALVLGLATAEAQLHRYRRASAKLLTETVTMDTFRTGVRRLTRSRTFQVLLVAGAFSGLAAGLVLARGATADLEVLRAWAYAELAACSFVALLLVASGFIVPVAVCTTAATGVVAGSLGFDLSPMARATELVVLAAVLLVALLGLAHHHLASPRAHR